MIKKWLTKDTAAVLLLSWKWPFFLPASRNESSYQFLTWMHDSSISGLAELMDAVLKLLSSAFLGISSLWRSTHSLIPKTEPERLFSLGKNLPCNFLVTTVRKEKQIEEIWNLGDTLPITWPLAWSSLKFAVLWGSLLWLLEDKHFANF